MDWTTFLTVIGTSIAVLGYLHSIKAEFRAEFARIDNRMNAIDHRMFYLATGRDLDEAIKQEKLKQAKTNV